MSKRSKYSAEKNLRYYWNIKTTIFQLLSCAEFMKLVNILSINENIKGMG